MKPKEIERLNPPAGQHDKKGAIDVRDHFKEMIDLHRPKSAPSPSATLTSPSAAKPLPTDVKALVQANAQKEQAAGLNNVGLDRPPHPSRRKRDYIVTLVLGNGLILGMMAFTGMNVISVMFGFAGIIVFTVSVTWIIWFLMDRY